MNILSIDTTTSSHSLALYTKNKKKAYIAPQGSTQSESLFEDINLMLQQEGIQYSDLNIILCNIGPGSFTGIRIGIAAVRGIKKILPHVNINGFATLEIIAYVYSTLRTHLDTQCFYTIINAFGNEFYIQKFNTNAQEESDINIVSLSSLIELAQDSPIISNDTKIIELFKGLSLDTRLVNYDAETIIKYYLSSPQRAKEVKPLYIKNPNIHHGAFKQRQ